MGAVVARECRLALAGRINSPPRCLGSHQQLSLASLNSSSQLSSDSSPIPVPVPAPTAVRVMYKLTICCMLIVVLATAALATNRPRPVCVGRCTVGDLRRTDWVCTRDARTNLCTKLRPCRLRERNCALRDLGLKPLRQTSLRQCANVRGIEGTARCAPTRNPVRVRSCVDRSCVNQRPNSCWRTRDGRNLWLSICDARRVNCVNRNKPLKQLVRVQDIKCRIKPAIQA